MNIYRKFNVMVRNEETGVVVQMNATPMSHPQACATLSKITNYPWRRKYLQETVTHASGEPA